MELPNPSVRQRYGKPLLSQPGFADIAIAATAQRHGLIILSRNVRHFAPMDVGVVDPLHRPEVEAPELRFNEGAVVECVPESQSARRTAIAYGHHQSMRRGLLSLRRRSRDEGEG